MTAAADATGNGARQEPGDLPTRTVVIEWAEESYHRTVVRVPLAFVADDAEMANELGRLYDNGFQSLERSGICVSEAAEHDPDAEYFDPPAC